MSNLVGRQPPPVPPRRKVPVGVTLNDYKSKQTEYDEGVGRAGDSFNNQMGGGGGLKAARQISNVGTLSSQSDPILSSLLVRDSLKDSVPESTIGAGVEIKGTMQFKRFVRRKLRILCCLVAYRIYNQFHFWSDCVQN